jgi:hypothetical protein
MMVYHTQNYWFFGLFPTSGILRSIKHDVSETGSVSVLRCGRKTPTQLCPLDRANLQVQWLRLALSKGHNWVKGKKFRMRIDKRMAWGRETEESQLLEAVARKRLVKTQQAGKGLAVLWWTVKCGINGGSVIAFSSEECAYFIYLCIYCLIYYLTHIPSVVRLCYTPKECRYEGNWFLR